VYTVLLRSGSPPGSAGRSRAARGSLDPVEPAAASDAVVLSAATAVWGLAFLLPWQAWEVVAGRAALPVGAGAVAATLYLGLVASAGTLLLWTYGAARACQVSCVRRCRLILIPVVIKKLVDQDRLVAAGAVPAWS